MGDLGSVAIGGGPRAFGVGSFLSRLLIGVARRFIAGTTLAEALAEAARLKAEGFSVTLDHLGEDTAGPAEARAAAQQYVIILRALKERGLDLNVSLKPTQLGISFDRNLFLENLMKVVDAAEVLGGFVRVDMEGSGTTDATLDAVCRTKSSRTRPVGTVLQAMLKRTPEDLLRLLDRGVSVRLCKGAYRERPDVAWRNTADIRREFMALAKRLLTGAAHPAIATHDEALIAGVRTFAREQGIRAEAFEFQMLLGIRPALQRRLVKDGWRVRIYVPFGIAWLPYVWRRLRERRENIWFVAKGIFQR